ncbi:DMT family transporter [Streptomyces glomeratus]|uniref:DMT family transporter n=1 Tax=Streptomyces glomeratus TaxID=284452 RepID=A0ABP6M0Y0_9ACTN|nr:DMT family transporter [Streptomyces glomeratus]MCF1508902.1 DMT family transporter [Streptomyces glomeratus]
MSGSVYAYGLAAACLLGLGFVLQQRAAQRAPLADMLRFRLLLDLVRDRVWLAGIGCMVAGQIFGVLALAKGDVSRVEPLLATNLLFAMALARRLSGQRLGWSGWIGVALLSGGVTAFIVASQPEAAKAPVGAVQQGLVLASLLGASMVMVVIAKHLRLVKEPPLLAAAGGLLYGIQDALTRMATGTFSAGGVLALLTTWQPYTVVALAVTGLLLVQSAFEAGLLRMSLPALTAAEPIAGIACGIGLLGDRLRVTPTALAWEVTGLVAVVVGVLLLGRHPAMPAGTAREDDAHRTPTESQ